MPTLQIVVSGHCLGCQEALRLYQEVSERFSRLRVELIDLERGDQPKPEAVIAVPSYLLNGKLLFVGNPHPGELFQKLSAFETPSAK